MPLYRVKFMTQVVETYVIDAEDEDAAWRTKPWQVDEQEPENRERVLLELNDVEQVTDEG